MPELPKLAIYAENLRPRVVGKAITAVKVDHSVAFKKIIAEEFVRSRNRDYFRVHLKTGKPCPQCGTKIAQEYFRNRITNWCPTCQIQSRHT